MQGNKIQINATKQMTAHLHRPDLKGKHEVLGCGMKMLDYLTFGTIFTNCNFDLPLIRKPVRHLWQSNNFPASKTHIN